MAIGHAYRASVYITLYVRIWSEYVQLQLYFIRGKYLRTKEICLTSVEISDLLHGRPWIPDDEKSTFTVVIHQWKSPLRQFTRVRTIDKNYVTMPAPRVHATLQISCGDVTMLGQKRPSLATMAKWAVCDRFLKRIAWSGHKIACKT